MATKTTDGNDASQEKEHAVRLIISPPADIINFTENINL